MDDLLGRFADDQGMAPLLRQSSNFEDVLSAVQVQYHQSRTPATKTQLDRLQQAILDTFHAMNRGFVARGQIEFSNDVRFSIRTFLSKFDAIFSLNQDLLLELYYNPELHNRQWNGVQFPGMQPPPNWHGAFPQDKLAAVWRPMQDFSVAANIQPVFKLHGSVNWRDRDDGELLILGADKQARIREKQILNWYLDQFHRSLSNNETRIMVIGYGFRDPHIDDIIYSAWQRSRLQMFLVVGERGRGVFDKQPHAQIKVRDKMEDIGLCGISTRRLSATFAGDHAELEKFERFFAR